MRYRKLTEDGDYSFGNSAKDFYRDVPAAVGQAVKTRILLWAGEWFLNVDDGTPFLISVLGKKTKEEADVTLQERILFTEGVTDLVSYTSVIDPVTRAMSVSCEIDTIYGRTQLEISNQSNY
jgi:hypothetical protein